MLCITEESRQIEVNGLEIVSNYWELELHCLREWEKMIMCNIVVIYIVFILGWVKIGA
jgi:hypothetical protein